MKDKIRSKIANLFAVITPYFVRAITSFLKYGFIACILLLIFDLCGCISVRTCCWLIIISGIIIELTKIVINTLIKKIKSEEEEDDESIR